MRITSKHLGRHAITIQYPEEKWDMPERSRGVVVLLSDKETGDLNCTGCLLCMRACPTAAIHVDAPRDENKKRQLKSFVVDFGLCCYCGLCEEACNFSAIKMATKYEYSSWDKETMIWDMKKLQEEGRDVPYVDTRKKRPVKKDTDAKAAPASEKKEEAPATTSEAKAEPKEEAAPAEPKQPTATNPGEETTKPVDDGPPPDKPEDKG
jgi:NADH-quinone oxidoreductase subunit I